MAIVKEMTGRNRAAQLEIVKQILTSRISEQSVNENPLFVMSHFSVAFKILLLPLSFESFIILYFSVDLLEFLILGTY